MSVRNMHHDPDHVAFTIRALKVYDNPKMGNGSSLVESPRLTLFGNIESLPIRKVSLHIDTKAYNNKEKDNWAASLTLLFFFSLLIK